MRAVRAAGRYGEAELLPGRRGLVEIPDHDDRMVDADDVLECHALRPFKRKLAASANQIGHGAASKRRSHVRCICKWLEEDPDDRSRSPLARFAVGRRDATRP